MQCFVRLVEADELEGFQSHLLRLDHQTRRDRFNGIVSTNFLEAYAQRSLSRGVVVGAFDGSLLIGASELQPASCAGEAEVAISIERPYQRKGLGYSLLSHLLSYAQEKAFGRIIVNMHHSNDAMRALVRKLGGKLVYSSGDVLGVIEIEKPLDQTRAA